MFSSKKQTPKEAARAQKRSITRSVRDIDRALVDLDKEEKLAAANAKKFAKSGDTKNAKAQAMAIVRIRNQKSKINQAKGRLNGISAQATVVQANAAVAGAVKGATKTMAKMNKSSAMSGMKAQQTAQRFAMESAKMEMTAEMMDDAMDAMDDEDADEEADDVLAGVLDEIGLDATAQLATAGTAKGKLPAEPTAESSKADAELEAMLKQLQSS